MDPRPAEGLRSEVVMVIEAGLATQYSPTPILQRNPVARQAIRTGPSHRGCHLIKP